MLECKVSTEKPWVVFTADGIDLADPARITQRACSELGLTFLSNLRDDPQALSLPLFRLEDRPAYGLTQAFTTGNDTTF